MTSFLGMLGRPDNDRALVNTVGQSVIYDAVRRYLDMHNADVQRVYRAFVGGQTSDFKRMYKLPANGKLARRSGQTNAPTRKTGGRWDVAFPLESFGESVGIDRETMAYMTLEQFSLELEGVRQRDINLRRFEILRAILNNTARTFVDDRPNVGTITIQPLANNDSVLYPPPLGSDTEAQRQHYITSGYVLANVSDSNNPVKTLRAKLDEMFGTPQGYGNVVVFGNYDAVDKIASSLSDFVDADDMHVNRGDDSDTVTGLPTVPGRIAGRANGAWVAEWRFIPSNYLVAVDLDAPAPLLERVHPDYTGLGSGLQLVSERDDFPLNYSEWIDDFGYGVANRLNGVVMELTADPSYDIPAGYA